MTNPLSSLAHRTARWCALHPWRAILGWVAFVALAVGLAADDPDPGDDRCRRPPGRVGSRRRDGRGRRLRRRGHRAGAHHGRSGDLDQAQAEQAAAEVVAGMTALQEVDAVAEPQVSPDGTAYLVSVQLARDQDDVDALQDVTEGRAGRLPGPGRPSVRGRQPRPGDRRAGRRRPRLGRDAQPADHADPDAAGLRRADRGRAAGPAGRHERGRDDRHPRPALAPGPRGLDRHEHDRADRHGGRGRLLALLPQARARGAGQGPLQPGRGGDRGPDLGPLDPGVGRGRDLLDGRAVPDRRLDVQLAGRRLDRGRRGRGARLDHRAPGAARQARPLGRPAARAAAAPR